MSKKIRARKLLPEDKTELPWSAPTPQVKGRQVEKKILRDRGSKAHPNSGAGKIKWDGSDQESVIEVKDAEKSFTIKKTLIRDLHKEASRQGKEGVLIIKFGDFLVEARIKRVWNSEGLE